MKMKEIYSKPVSKIEEFSAVEVLTASGIEQGDMGLD